MIPNDKSFCEIDPDVKDRWGIPVLRFHWEWSDHELNQVRHMQQTFRDIFESMGGRVAAGGGRGGGAGQTTDPTARVDRPPISRGGAIIHEVGTVRMGDDPEDERPQQVLPVARRQEPVRRRRRAVCQQSGQEPDAHDRCARLADSRVSRRRIEEGQCLRSHVAMPCAGWRWPLPRPASSTASTRAKSTIMASQATTAGGAYTPTTFTGDQFKTLERLADLIIPVENGKPGALAAGAAPWIDMISSENDDLKASYAKGFAWLDATMKARGAKDFASASLADQTALLDLIAYRRNASPELTPGHRVLHARAAHDRRRVLHERDRHQGHRLSRQLADGVVPLAHGGDRVRAQARAQPVASARHGHVPARAEDRDAELQSSALLLFQYAFCPT